MRNVYKIFLLLGAVGIGYSTVADDIQHAGGSAEDIPFDAPVLPNNIVKKVPCTPEMLARGAINLQRITDQIYDLCRDSTGKLDTERIIKDESGNEISCSLELNRARMMRSQFEEMQSTGMCPAECAICKVASGEGDLQKFLAGMNQKRACTVDEKAARAPSKCVGEILKSVTVVGLITNLPKGENICAVEVINGIIQDLLSNAHAIADLGKMAWNATSNKVTGWWRSWTGTEDKLADAAHLASSESNSFLSRFMKEPGKVTKELFATLWDMINSSIKNNFGCSKWAGFPHASQCLQPMDSWECASCAQMTTAFCGVAGFLTGEIVSTFIMGAGISKVATISVKASAAAAKVVAKFAPSVAEAGKGMTEAAKGVITAAKSALEFSKTSWEAFLQSPSAKAVFEHLSPLTSGVHSAKEEFAASLKELTSSAEFKRGAKIVKVAAYPLKTYFQILNEAGKCGFEVGSKPWLFKGLPAGVSNATKPAPAIPMTVPAIGH